MSFEPPKVSMVEGSIICEQLWHWYQAGNWRLNLPLHFRRGIPISQWDVFDNLSRRKPETLFQCIRDGYERKDAPLMFTACVALRDRVRPLIILDEMQLSIDEIQEITNKY